MPYVDTHCHLDHHEGLSVAEQVRRARAADVQAIITVGTDLASSRQAVASAQGHAGVAAAVGIHPNDAETATDEALSAIAELAHQPGVVAIGESGLDFYRDWASPVAQEASLRAHIDLARSLDRTLVLHCRDAWSDLLRILQDHGAPERVVLHCFSGDAEVARRCAGAGWYLSFAGNVTFKNATALREAAAVTPLAALLTETDSPFLTPHPHRGESNDPSFVPLTLEVLAEVLQLPPEEVRNAVWDNAHRVFGLER